MRMLYRGEKVIGNARLEFRTMPIGSKAEDDFFFAQLSEIIATRLYISIISKVTSKNKKQDVWKFIGNKLGKWQSPKDMR